MVNLEVKESLLISILDLVYIQRARESDIDYGDSEELKILDSNDDEGKTSRKRSMMDVFNLDTDMEEPIFRTWFVLFFYLKMVCIDIFSI